jgi:hypothetical protein
MRQGTRTLPLLWAKADSARWSRVTWSVPDSVPTWPLEIDARDSVALVIESRLTWSGGCDANDCGRMFRYTASPARLWKGTIRRARIAMHLGPILTRVLRHALKGESGIRVEIRPQPYTWTSNGILWEFENWEPKNFDDDPRVSIDWTEDPLPEP